MNPYTEYKLTHWEEPEIFQRVTAKDGIVSVTPEHLYRALQSYFPVGYQEGEITIDVTVDAFVAFWESLGGEVEAS